MRINRQACVFARESFLFARQAKFLPTEIDQVGGIAAIDDGEGRIQCERLRVLA